MTPALHVGQAGFEGFLAKEAGSCVEKGPGWVLAAATRAASEPCFAHLRLAPALEFRAASVRELGASLGRFFRETSVGRRYGAPWALTFECAAVPGLGRRCRLVEAAFREATSHLARVMRLAQAGRPPAGLSSGLAVYLTDFGRAFASREVLAGGQRRMADDAQAPSRSFLKIEEACMILGRAPGPGESVVDLGAAPGGWSYAAARRGARVQAVDNGPLKGGAAGHPLIAPLREDAFAFRPRQPVDWLFCDLLDDPDRVLPLLERWLQRRWCRRFAVNLKFGRRDPFALARTARDRLAALAGCLRVRHLYHDREELTLVGEANIV